MNSFFNSFINAQRAMNKIENVWSFRICNLCLLRKEFCLVFLCILFVKTIRGQNLVPNPSFEVFNNCPMSLDGVKYDPSYTSFPFVSDWINPMFQTTSDYYNVCAPAFPASWVSVPNNWLSNATAHSGGGYVGIIPYELSSVISGVGLDYREYVECKLLHPLVAGTVYAVSFFARFAFKPSFGYNFVAVDKIGAYFSDTAIYSNSLYNLHFQPQIQNSLGSFIVDTNSWTKISGSFIAHGNEQWITIGFFNDSLPVHDSLICPVMLDSTKDTWSYLYIDDVRVIDTIMCDSSVRVTDTIFCGRPADFRLFSTD